MKRMIVLEIVCFLLIALFLFASVSRWLDFRTFTGDINNQPLPNQYTPLITYTIPTLEFLAALALMFERTRTWGLWIAFGITFLYIIYNVLILAHFFGRVPCSCGGMIKNLSWGQHLVFSLVFAGVSATGILLRRKYSTKKNTPAMRGV